MYNVLCFNHAGKYTPTTWTLLEQTASAGDMSITTQIPTNWEVGAQIVIATTGDMASQKEMEVRTIASVSADGLTLTLDEALEYEHLGETQTFGSGVNEATVEVRAEVGLLSHNVVFKGDGDERWEVEIPACDADFSPGEPLFGCMHI